MQSLIDIYLADFLVSANLIELEAKKKCQHRGTKLDARACVEAPPVQMSRLFSFFSCVFTFMDIEIMKSVAMLAQAEGWVFPHFANCRLLVSCRRAASRCKLWAHPRTFALTFGTFSNALTATSISRSTGATRLWKFLSALNRWEKRWSAYRSLDEEPRSWMDFCREKLGNFVRHCDWTCTATRRSSPSMRLFCLTVGTVPLWEPH